MAQRKQRSNPPPDEELDDDLVDEVVEPRARSRPRRKLVTAALVLLAGIGAAVVFRKPVEPVDESASSDSGLVLREDVAPLEPRPAPQSHLVGKIDPIGPFDAAAMPESSAADSPPPLIGQAYPDQTSAGVAAPGAAKSAVPASAAGYRSNAPIAGTHRIVDGDTLMALAERYLGSSSRYVELFEANRDVLDDAEILPIGAELRIPDVPRTPPGTAPSDAAPLVPIPRGSLDRHDKQP